MRGTNSFGARKNFITPLAEQALHVLWKGFVRKQMCFIKDFYSSLFIVSILTVGKEKE